MLRRRRGVTYPVSTVVFFSWCEQSLHLANCAAHIVVATPHHLRLRLRLEAEAEAEAEAQGGWGSGWLRLRAIHLLLCSGLTLLPRQLDDWLLLAEAKIIVVLLGAELLQAVDHCYNPCTERHLQVRVSIRRPLGQQRGNADG